MTGPRVSIDDLLGAADWIRAYEGPDGVIGDHGPAGDERAVELLRVAAWLDAEVARRQEAAAVRQIAARSGRPTSVARAAYRRHTAPTGGA